MTSMQPVAPAGRVAPGTHPLELQRLALQETTHPACDPLLVQGTLWLLRAANAVTNAQADDLRHLGLSPSAFNVLMSLHNTPEAMLEPCQLAERLLLSRPSMTGLLDTLQAKGLVVRAPHPDDGRRVRVELTEAARDLLGSHFAEHYHRQAELFADLSADDLAALVCTLRRVRGAAPPHLAG